MKKNQRLSLNGLEEIGLLLNDSARTSILGGKDIKNNGGFLQKVNGGGLYTEENWELTQIYRRYC